MRKACFRNHCYCHFRGYYFFAIMHCQYMYTYIYRYRIILYNALLCIILFLLLYNTYFKVLIYFYSIIDMVIILHLPNKCSTVLNLRQNICIGISKVASKYFPFSYTSFSNKFYEIYIQKYNLKDISNRIIGYVNHDRILALVPKNNHVSWQLLFLLTLKKNSQLHTKLEEKMNEDLQQLLQKLP